jgi:alpha-galactosidase
MLTWDGACLTAANAHILRRWRLVDGALVAIELRDRLAGCDWIRPGSGAGMVPPGGAPAGPWTASWEADPPVPPWEDAAERGRLHVRGADGRSWTLAITVPADAPGITCQLTMPHPVASGGSVAGPGQAATGIEVDEAVSEAERDDDVAEALDLALRHLDLLAVDLLDQSDQRGTPVQERRWRCYPGERIALRTGLVCLESTTGGPGLTLVRHAPPPHARAWMPGPDLIVHRGRLRLCGHGCGDAGIGHAWTVLVHGAGAWARAQALHRLSRQRRRRMPEREGRFITNTWGDRNRDGRIAAPFLIAEAAAAAALGADAMQVDAGWQRGVDANSVDSHGAGVWTGFWDADPAFWDEHPRRLPAGLAPIAAAARTQGIDLGLWFAPDSSRQGIHWQRDAERLVALGRRHGIAHWKFDAMKLDGRTSELRLERLLAEVWQGSDGRAWVDLDITAEHRPGFLGADPVGCLFVQNRYSDWGNWWPHETLRTLWELAWWLPPQRLRVEFLNPFRNAARYGDDPLAPSRYPLDWAMATTLVANPLGWFEASNLPPAFAQAIAALAGCWRNHRVELHGGTVLPVGPRPGGAATCGFLSLGADGTRHLLVFREPQAVSGANELLLPATGGPWRRIAGSGSCTASSQGVVIDDLPSPGWGWFRS